MLTIEEKIKILCRRTGIGIEGLAARVGCSRQNLYLKLRRGNWKEADLKAYADALGYEYDVVFVNKETGERL